MNLTVLATKHNCEIRKEYNKLRGNNYDLPHYIEPTQDGAVLLKYINSINETSDNRAFYQVELLISEYRYKENLRQSILPFATL